MAEKMDKLANVSSSNEMMYANDSASNIKMGMRSSSETFYNMYKKRGADEEVAETVSEEVAYDTTDWDVDAVVDEDEL